MSPSLKRTVRSERFRKMIGRCAGTSLVRRRRGGARASSAAARRRPIAASAMLAAAQTARSPAQGSIRIGAMPARVAAGNTTKAATSSRRELGTIIAGPSSGYGHVVQNAIQHLAGAHALQLRFGPQQEAVLQGRRSDSAYIVGADEIASLQGSPRAAARQQ